MSVHSETPTITEEHVATASRQASATCALIGAGSRDDRVDHEVSGTDT